MMYPLGIADKAIASMSAGRKVAAMDNKLKLRGLVKRAIIAYLGAGGMVLFFVVISVSRGRGFKPLLIPLPLFIIVFGGITYQLIKEIRALRREDPQEPK